MITENKDSFMLYIRNIANRFLRIKLAIIKEQDKYRGSDQLFPGRKQGCVSYVHLAVRGATDCYIGTKVNSVIKALTLKGRDNNENGIPIFGITDWLNNRRGGSD